MIDFRKYATALVGSTALIAVLPIAGTVAARAPHSTLRSSQTASQQHSITILAETHDNDSGLIELVHQVKKAPTGTIVAIEFPTIINGTVQAYYDNKITKQEFTTMLRGSLLAPFEKHAYLMTDVITLFKERGNPVIFMDGRYLYQAREKAISTLEEYREAKLEQLEEQIGDVNIKISKLRQIGGQEDQIDGFKAFIAARRQVVQSSLITIERCASYSHVNFDAENVADDLIRQNNHTRDVYTAVILAGYSQHANVIALVGEQHIAGNTPSSTPTDPNGLIYGIVGDSLRALGQNPQIYVVRPDAASFVDIYDPASQPVIKEQVDGYIVNNPTTGERRVFGSIDKLGDSALNSFEIKHRGTYSPNNLVITMEGVRGLPSFAENKGYHRLLAGIYVPSVQPPRANPVEILALPEVAAKQAVRQRAEMGDISRREGVSTPVDATAHSNASDRPRPKKGATPPPDMLLE